MAHVVRGTHETSVCLARAFHGSASDMVFASEDEEPRNAKEKGVEDVDDRVDDVQVREAENSEGVTFVET